MNCTSVTATNLHERTMGAKLRDGQNLSVVTDVSEDL
jgi:hypothetical protein